MFILNKSGSSCGVWLKLITLPNPLSPFVLDGKSNVYSYPLILRIVEDTDFQYNLILDVVILWREPSKLFGLNTTADFSHSKGLTFMRINSSYLKAT